jgi:hypothetical protein
MTAPKVSRPPSRSEKLPSVETQTVAFVEHARSQRRAAVSRWLKWGGFAIYLRYYKHYTAEGVRIGEVLVIASVESPIRYRRRGWFWRYCQLCLALVDDGLIIESVVNEELIKALSMRPEFVEVSPSTFFLKKRGPDHRPELHEPSSN